MFPQTKKVVAGIAALAALALGGSAIAGAATSNSSSNTSSGSPQGRPAFSGPAHGTAAHEDAEKTVTGTAADKAKAAAIKAVGGGTAGSVTTDFTQRGYEVTVTKTNGSKVEVHLDSSFAVMQHPGGPGGPGHMGPPNGAPPNGSIPG